MAASGAKPSCSYRVPAVWKPLTVCARLPTLGHFSIQIILGECAMKLSYALVGAVLMSGVFAATQSVAEDPHHDDHHAAPQGGGHGGPPPGGHGGAPPGGGHPGGPPGGH